MIKSKTRQNPIVSPLDVHAPQVVDAGSPAAMWTLTKITLINTMRNIANEQSTYLKLIQKLIDYQIEELAKETAIDNYPNNSTILLGLETKKIKAIQRFHDLTTQKSITLTKIMNINAKLGNNKMSTVNMNTQICSLTNLLTCLSPITIVGSSTDADVFIGHIKNGASVINVTSPLKLQNGLGIRAIQFQYYPPHSDDLAENNVNLQILTDPQYKCTCDNSLCEKVKSYNIDARLKSWLNANMMRRSISQHNDESVEYLLRKPVADLKAIIESLQLLTLKLNKSLSTYQHFFDFLAQNVHFMEMYSSTFPPNL